MWGAITANLTRSLFDNPSSEDYEAVGNFVRENIRTTYFYPAIKEEDEINVENLTEFCIEINGSKFGVFLPKYADGLKFGEISKEKFEQIFIGSFVSTALDAGTKTAEEGSLHEFEFIKHKIDSNSLLNGRKFKFLQVYWLGYLFVKCESSYKSIKIEDCENDDVKISKDGKTYSLKRSLSTIQVGGERNYGLGMLELSDRLYLLTNNTIFEKFEIELNENPIIKADILPAHLSIDENQKESITTLNGEIEPVVGLEWSDKGAGQKVSDAEICGTPGSKLKPCNFILCDYGILKTA